MTSTIPTKKWDHRFMSMAKLLSSWSKDPSTQAGAVIVRPDRTIVSVGFNGFPKTLRDSLAEYNNRDFKYSKIIHAEMNALLHSSERVTGCTLYTYPLAPCDRCVVHLIQAGISRFVFPPLPIRLVSRWGTSLERTLSYIREAKAEGCQLTK